jgi:hypothetical protein
MNAETINGQTFTDLWTSTNKQWKIIHRRYMPGPRGFAIEVHRRNRYDYYEHVTPFDMHIPQYVQQEWERIYYGPLAEI